MTTKLGRKLTDGLTARLDFDYACNRGQCTEWGHVWRQDTTAVAQPRAKISRTGLRWGLVGIVIGHLSMSRVAEGLGVSWNTANNAVLAEGQRLLINDPTRPAGVQVVGVDEHVWRHTRKGDKYVTVIIDLTPVRDGTGPSRLLDVVEGRSKKAFKNWLAQRDHAWRDGIEVVAMDGFAGFKTATTEELPDTVTVMDPFHVVRLAGDALNECRRRVQQELHGHRGRTGDPLYTARRTLHTGADLLTQRQHERLDKLFADDEHVQVEATWGIYQRMIHAYRDPDRAGGRIEMRSVIDALTEGVPGRWLSCASSAAPYRREPPTSWPTSNGPAPATDPPRQ